MKIPSLNLLNPTNMEERIAARRFMSQVHANAYEASKETRKLDTQVGPLVNGCPSLAITPPGIKTVPIAYYVEKIESFLAKVAARHPGVKNNHRFGEE